MSDAIRRAAARLVRSKAFLDTFAELLTAEMGRELRCESGGQRFYVAKKCGKNEKHARNERIRERIGAGENLAEIVKEIGLSKRQVRRICGK